MRKPCTDCPHNRKSRIIPPDGGHKAVWHRCYLLGFPMGYYEMIANCVDYAVESTSEHKGLVYLDFLAGAEWADETMIDKACEWLRAQMYQEYGGGPLERLVSDERSEDFRRAMEE